MKNLKLSHKILTLSLVIITTFCLTIGFIYQQAKANLYSARQDMVEDVVSTSWGIIQHYKALAEQGQMQVADAQTAAQEVNCRLETPVSSRAAGDWPRVI